MIKKNKNARYKVKKRIRKKILGTPEIPRLTVYRSLGNIYGQVIDDSNSKTLAAASSLSKEIKDEVKSAKGKVSKSKLIGGLVAKKAIEKNITKVVFDRNGYRYHGRVKAFADGAREGGLKF